MFSSLAAFKSRILESTKAELVSLQLRVGLFTAGALLCAWRAAGDRKSSQREPEKQEMCPVCEEGCWLPRAKVDVPLLQCPAPSVSECPWAIPAAIAG